MITAAGNVIAPDMKGVTLRQANVNEFVLQADMVLTARSDATVLLQ